MHKRSNLRKDGGGKYGRKIKEKMTRKKKYQKKRFDMAYNKVI